ncbi:uncharacterized protein BHQ10_002973 [Talaromyces amestolkiae]|uniref:Uncharacterized protein n=1 Tax=Talaromyces amestolkiae TaxID=1196081 RepID=A0A364KTZ4_TALAM|nr:uncharacterized protein BHQ10_002973 [Talaromyces amestolkiae]RAO66961.1 hypothetical protein BHQ10_002973 [Talaromyces amestolkiae]
MTSPPNVSIEAIEAAITAAYEGPAEEQVHHFRCTLADFMRLALKDRLIDRRGLREPSFNPYKETLSFLTSPTPMQCCPRSWFKDWVFKLREMNPELPGKLRVNSPWLPQIFRGQYLGGCIGTYASFFPRFPSMPLIILEAGYAKSYDDLVDDATLLLEGAEGEINMVIIVKMEPLVEGETSFKSGFTEIWKFDEEDMKAKIYGPRLDLLGDQSSSIAPKDDPLPLKLDDLRDELEISVQQHFYNENREALCEQSLSLLQ